METNVHRMPGSQAADLNINPTAYRKLAQAQIHYALGDTGRSFVVGFGNNPPVKPHHSSRYDTIFFKQ